MRRTTSKRKKKSVKLLKKLRFGESFTLGSMMKTGITYKGLLRLLLMKLELLKKPLTTICFKSEAVKNMDSILMKKSMLKLVNLEHLFEIKKRKKLEESDMQLCSYFFHISLA
jgi:hypothetical protein